MKQIDNFSTLITHIKNETTGGFDVQKIYSPPYRKVYSEDEILKLQPKIAAVNILLCFNEAKQICFPIMKRTTNSHDVHSGQISLPGGSKEATDPSTLHTALRETQEELGVDVSKMEIIKAISPLYIPVSNFYVYPYISVSENHLYFTPQESEVQEIILCPISEIIQMPNPPKMQMLAQTRNTEVPVFYWEDQCIWGATAMILHEFSCLIKNV